jgi:hypothetical protein
VDREREPGFLREELEATLSARRELGAELEPQLIEGFLERAGKAIDARVDTRLERKELPDEPGRHVAVGVALGSLGIGIPLTGAAGGTVGFAGVLVVWIGIVFVNLAYALGNRG